MAALKQFAFVLFHTMVLAFAIFLFSLSVMPMRAQSITQIQIENLDKRLVSIESLNIDRRLSVVERILMDMQESLNEMKDSNTMQRLTTGGTSLLLIEGIYRNVRKSKPGDAN